MLKTNQSQRGLTMISWLILLGVIGFLIYLLIKIVPLYIGGFNSYSSVDSMRTELLDNKSISEIRTMVWRRLDINMVKGVSKDDIFITKAKDKVVIELDYEVRENIFANLDVVIRFHKVVNVPRRNARL